MLFVFASYLVSRNVCRFLFQNVSVAEAQDAIAACIDWFSTTKPDSLKHVSSLAKFEATIVDKVRARGKELKDIRENILNQRKAAKSSPADGARDGKDVKLANSEVIVVDMAEAGDDAAAADDDEEDSDAVAEADEQKADIWGWEAPPKGNLIQRLTKFELRAPATRFGKAALDVKDLARQWMASVRDHLIKRFPKDPVLDAFITTFEPKRWSQSKARDKDVLAATKILADHFGGESKQSEGKVSGKYVDAAVCAREVSGFVDVMSRFLSDDLKRQRLAVERKETTELPQLATMKAFIKHFLTSPSLVK